METFRRPKPAGAPELGDWIWLFPLAYGLHIADELWSAEGFPAWIGAHAGVALTEDRFLLLNALFFAGMLVFVVLARWWRPEAIVVLAAVIAINGILHVGASMVTRTFGPGLVTSLLVWLPLGLGTLRWGAHRFGGRAVGICVVLGALVHLGIVGVLWSGGA